MFGFRKNRISIDVHLRDPIDYNSMKFQEKSAFEKLNKLEDGRIINELGVKHNPKSIEYRIKYDEYMKLKMELEMTEYFLNKYPNFIFIPQTTMVDRCLKYKSLYIGKIDYYKGDDVDSSFLKDIAFNSNLIDVEDIIFNYVNWMSHYLYTGLEIMGMDNRNKNIFSDKSSKHIDTKYDVHVVDGDFEYF